MAYETTTDRIIALLEENPTIKGGFTILNGDPTWIPTSMLPCIIVVKTGSTTDDGPTGADLVTEEISIRIVYNMNDYMGGSMTENIPHNKIVESIEARKDTGEYEDNSIIGMIRKSYTLGNSVIGQRFNTRYELLMENRSTSEGVVTLEGHLTFATRQLIAVPTRT